MRADADGLSRQLPGKETEIADLIGALWAVSQPLLSAGTIRQLNDHLGAISDHLERVDGRTSTLIPGLNNLRNAINSQSRLISSLNIQRTGQMHDTPARNFAAYLYSGLAFGNSVKRAFHQACATIGDEPDSVMPQLFFRHGRDPHPVVLVRPEEGGTP